jgi:hypothetical protein
MYFTNIPYASTRGLVDGREAYSRLTHTRTHDLGSDVEIPHRLKSNRNLLLRPFPPLSSLWRSRRTILEAEPFPVLCPLRPILYKRTEFLAYDLVDPFHGCVENRLTWSRDMDI